MSRVTLMPTTMYEDKARRVFAKEWMSFMRLAIDLSRSAADGPPEGWSHLKPMKGSSTPRA
jgi:hypothetical protein